MTRSTNMEHVEVLRDLSECCRAAIKAGDWKVDGACDPDAVLRRADAAIAALSAPKPRMVGCEGDDGLLRTHPEAETCDVCAPKPEPAESAPVGVDGWVVETVEDDPNLLVINTPNKRSWIAQRGDRVFELAEALALAQQPAAVDAADAKDAEIEALRAEVEEARGLVTEANNSLYGSQSYFHSLDGGPYNRHHLANGIEDLKRRAREGYAAEARAERLAEALRLIAAPMRSDGTWNRDREACRQIARAALRDHDQEVGNG